MQRECEAEAGDESIELSGSDRTARKLRKRFFINHESIVRKRAYESCLINFSTLLPSCTPHRGKFHRKLSSAMECKVVVRCIEYSFCVFFCLQRNAKRVELKTMKIPIEDSRDSLRPQPTTRYIFIVIVKIRDNLASILSRLQQMTCSAINFMRFVSSSPRENFSSS